MKKTRNFRLLRSLKIVGKKLISFYNKTIIKDYQIPSLTDKHSLLQVLDKSILFMQYQIHSERLL